MFFLSGSNAATGAVKHDESRTGCALIEGSDVACQFSTSPLFSRYAGFMWSYQS
jgi:hypothetical protein